MLSASGLKNLQPNVTSPLRGEIREALLVKKRLRLYMTEQISEKELEKFYQANMRSFQFPERVFIVTLYKRTKDKEGMDLPDEQREQLRRDIEALYQEIVSISNDEQAAKRFVEIARKNSDSPYDGERCIRGWEFKQSQFERENKNRAKDRELSPEATRLRRELDRKTEVSRQVSDFYFRQEIGKISPVYESPVGYHLAMIIARRPPTGLDFESTREAVLDYLEPKYRGQLLKILIDQIPVIGNFNGLSDEEVRKYQAALTSKNK